jgi:hypothetical protein
MIIRVTIIVATIAAAGPAADRTACGGECVVAGGERIAIRARLLPEHAVHRAGHSCVSVDLATRRVLVPHSIHHAGERLHLELVLGMVAQRQARRAALPAAMEYVMDSVKHA